MYISWPIQYLEGNKANLKNNKIIINTEANLLKKIF